MLSKLLAKSQYRMDCANNYMQPSLNEITLIFRYLEKIAYSDYQMVFGNRQQFVKGTHLLREGQIATNFWFIEEGIARQYFYKNGKDVCNDFFFPCEFVDAYGTSVLELPSRVNIQLVSDAWVRIINYEALRNLESKYPVLQKAEQLIIACNVLWLEERLYSIQHLSAADRYKMLMDKQPHLIKDIPLSYIASYLGISLETLSRIRAKLRFM